MKHEDFLAQYTALRVKEVTALNDVLKRYFSGEYHFENHPYVTAIIPNSEAPLTAKVMAVKSPVSSDCGILVMPTEYEGWGYDDPIEIGYGDISFGDIDGILDYLPEQDM